MDKRRPNKMAYAADLKAPKEDLQKDSVYDFLAGVDDVFDPIQSNSASTPFSMKQNDKLPCLAVKLLTSSSMTMVSKSPSTGPLHSLRIWMKLKMISFGAATAMEIVARKEHASKSMVI